MNESMFPLSKSNINPGEHKEVTIQILYLGLETNVVAKRNVPITPIINATPTNGNKNSKGGKKLIKIGGSNPYMYCKSDPQASQELGFEIKSNPQDLKELLALNTSSKSENQGRGTLQWILLRFR